MKDVDAMSKLSISKSAIKRLFSTAVYRRGKAYYRQGRVKNIGYNPVQNIWYGKVAGENMYDVSVQEFEHHNLEVHCTCRAHEAYSECKHAVALLLELTTEHSDKENEAQENDFIKKWKYQTAEQFIDLFSAYHYNVLDIKKQTAKQPLQVEFICRSLAQDQTDDMLLTIEMKVGIDHLYVVKNIQQFLMKVKQGTPHEFTKKFTYDPLEHYFQDEDIEIISQLEEITSQQDIYQQSLYSWQTAYTNARRLIIPPLIAEELLNKLHKRKFIFINKEQTYDTISFEKKELPFSFHLSKNEIDEFEVHFKDFLDTTYFKRYDWVFFNGTFYHLTEEQKLFLEALFTFQSKAPGESLTIAQDQMSSFLSQVIPALKKVGEVKVSEKIANQMIHHPLQAKIFIDEDKDKLRITVEYHYGEFSINPFIKEKATLTDEVLLLRDPEKEHMIMSTIENSPLKFNGKELFLNTIDEENVYDFLFRVLPALETYADIYMADSVKAYMNMEQPPPVTSIDVEPDGSLLDVSFDMDGIEKAEVKKILTSVVEKKKYYRMKDGSFLSLEKDAFQQIDKLFHELRVDIAELDRDHLKVPVYRGLQIDNIVRSDSSATKFGKAFRHLVEHLKHPEKIDFPLPKSVNATLRGYQKSGFQWFKSLAYYHLGGILADDMGLGKTLQSITYLVSEKEHKNVKKPFLVIVPASLVYNWYNEFQQFSPAMKVVVAVGTRQERREIFQAAERERPDVWITSYPTLRQDIEIYKEMEFDTIILDEAQAIKNPLTKTANAVRKLQADKRFALSGTPIENSLDELWSIFQTILPGFFPNLKDFKKLPHDKIATMIRPFILRRVKKDVLKELPDKIETEHLSELTKEQKELYLAYLDQIKQETADTLANDDFHRNRMKILAGITRLRQLCCHPSLFIENYEGKSGKLEQLMDIMQTAIDNGNRLLIFSQFTSMLKIIKERLDKEKVTYFYLDGNTPAKQRVDMSRRFNHGEKTVFLISLKAGGTGLNLTGADTVILYDLWWNPAVEEQAAGRAHRMGQKNVVQVIRLISQGTIEEKIYELQEKKRELIEKVIQPGETMLTSLSEQEIREILNI